MVCCIICWRSPAFLASVHTLSHIKGIKYLNRYYEANNYSIINSSSSRIYGYKQNCMSDAVQSAKFVNFSYTTLLNTQFHTLLVQLTNYRFQMSKFQNDKCGWYSDILLTLFLIFYGHKDQMPGQYLEVYQPLPSPLFCICHSKYSKFVP